MSKMSEKEVKKRLDFILNGFADGQTMTEVAKLIGISKQALGTFLDRHWKASLKKKLI